MYWSIEKVKNIKTKNVTQKNIGVNATQNTYWNNAMKIQ